MFNTQFKPRILSGITAKGGKTKQAAAADADINLILRKYNMTKIPPPTTPPIFADRVILPKTLQEAIDKVETAFQWFDELPANVRQAFNNDPVSALELVNTDLRAAIAKGLIPASTPVVDNSKPKGAEAPTPEPSKTAKPEPEPAEA